MKGNFIKNFSVIALGTLINMAIGVLTTPVITRLVSPEEYGQFSVFQLYADFLFIIAYLGLDQALIRYYYQEDSVDYKRFLLLKCIRYPIIICILIGITLLVLERVGLFTFELGNVLLVLLICYLILQVIYRFSLLLVRLQYKSKLYAFLGIIQKVTYIMFVLPVVVLYKKNNLYTLVIGTVLSITVCVFISIVSEKNIWDFKSIKKKCVDVSQKELLKYAIPFVFSACITTLFQALDKISLNTYRSYSEVGVYSSAITLISLFSVIYTSFTTLWSPMSIEHYTTDPDDKLFYKKANSIVTVVMFFIGVTLILFKDVFALFFGEKYREAAFIMPFLIFNPIMYTVSETTVCGLVFKKKSNLQIVVAVVACCVNFIGNTLLVPKLGCKGAAISTGISYIVFFSVRTLLSNKYYKIDYDLKKFYLLTIVVALYAAYNTFYSFDIFSLIGYIFCLGVIFILYKKTVVWGIDYILKYLKNWLFMDNSG